MVSLVGQGALLHQATSATLPFRTDKGFAYRFICWRAPWIAALLQDCTDLLATYAQAVPLGSLCHEGFAVSSLAATRSPSQPTSLAALQQWPAASGGAAQGAADCGFAATATLGSASGRLEAGCCCVLREGYSRTRDINPQLGTWTTAGSREGCERHLHTVPPHTYGELRPHIARKQEDWAHSGGCLLVQHRTTTGNLLQSAGHLDRGPSHVCQFPWPGSRRSEGFPSRRGLSFFSFGCLREANCSSALQSEELSCQAVGREGVYWDGPKFAGASASGCEVSSGTTSVVQTEHLAARMSDKIRSCRSASDVIELVNSSIEQLHADDAATALSRLAWLCYQPGTITSPQLSATISSLERCLMAHSHELSARKVSTAAAALVKLSSDTTAVYEVSAPPLEPPHIISLCCGCSPPPLHTPHHECLTLVASGFACPSGVAGPGFGGCARVHPS